MGIVPRPISSDSLYIPLELRDGHPDVFKYIEDNWSLRKHSDVPGQTELVQICEEKDGHYVVPRFFLPGEHEALLGVDYRDISDRTSMGLSHVVEARNFVQDEAMAAMDASHGGILNLACGYGKTVIMSRTIAIRDKRTIIFVASGMLMEQWGDELRKFLRRGDKELKDSDIILAAGGDHFTEEALTAWEEAAVVVCMLQSAHRNLEALAPYAKLFGTVVFDECHHVPARTFYSTARIFPGDRFALTATIERQDGLHEMLYHLVGDIIYSHLKGFLTAEVVFRNTDITIDLDDKIVRELVMSRNRLHPSKLLSYLQTIPDRNRFICRQALREFARKEHVLVMSHGVEHCSVLAAMIHTLPGCPTDLRVGVVTGAVKPSKRKEVIESNNITFATIETTKEALSVPSLTRVVFATPFKDWIVFQQGSGRVEREHPGKDFARAVVIHDNMIPMSSGTQAKLMARLRYHERKYTIEERKKPQRRKGRPKRPSRNL